MARGVFPRRAPTRHPQNTKTHFPTPVKETTHKAAVDVLRRCVDWRVALASFVLNMLNRRHDVANTLGLAVVFATTDNVATVARAARHVARSAKFGV